MYCYKLICLADYLIPPWSNLISKTHDLGSSAFRCQPADASDQQQRLSEHLLSTLRMVPRASEMAQQVRALDNKPEDPSSVPTVEGAMQSHKPSSDFHVYDMEVHVPPSVNIRKCLSTGGDSGPGQCGRRSLRVMIPMHQHHPRRRDDVHCPGCTMDQVTQHLRGHGVAV